MSGHPHLCIYFVLAWPYPSSIEQVHVARKVSSAKGTMFQYSQGEITTWGWLIKLNLVIVTDVRFQNGTRLEGWLSTFCCLEAIIQPIINHRKKDKNDDDVGYWQFLWQLWPFVLNIISVTIAILYFRYTFYLKWVFVFYFSWSFGMLGSIDANTGSPDLGWDTDQFPMDIRNSTVVMKVRRMETVAFSHHHHHHHLFWKLQLSSTLS